MGGGTAIDLALAHPARVRSLTLLGPGVSGYEWPTDPERVPGADHFLALREPELVAATILRQCESYVAR